MSFTNEYMPTTIVHPLYEVQTKGGINDVLNPGGFDNELVRLGKRIMSNRELMDKDVDMVQTNMCIQQFVPVNGYHPVQLVSRGDNLM